MLRLTQSALNDGSLLWRFLPTVVTAIASVSIATCTTSAASPTHHRDLLHIHWLQAEHDLLRRLIPRHLNVTGTFTGIASGCERDLEALP